MQVSDNIALMLRIPQAAIDRSVNFTMPKKVLWLSTPGATPFSAEQIPCTLLKREPWPLVLSENDRE